MVGRFAAVEWLKPSLRRAGEQQLHQADIALWLSPREAIFAAVNALNLEFLPGLNTILFPDFGRDDDLPFG
jgi:hypothetical protein